MNGTSLLAQFDLREIATFFFIMLGPVKLLGPFAKTTAQSDEGERRSVALQSTLIATLTILAASFIGESLLQKWQINPGALLIAAGIIFFLVALNLVLAPYNERPRPEPPPAEPPKAAELVRLLVPQIVTPYGIATVILALSQTAASTIAVVGVLLAIMVMDLVAMLFARPILRLIAFPLQIVGTVMSVLQVALSVQMVATGIGLIVGSLRPKA